MKLARPGRLWWALPLLAVVYVLLVLGASRWLGSERIDLTRDHLYTLSPGTLDIIEHLQQPIDLTLYFSDRASHSLPQLRAYHQRVVHMLDQVVRHSHGKIHLTQVDPQPFSEDEDRATAAGLTSVRGEGTGQAIFFGLAGRNAGDGRSSAIPFFLPAKEPFVEYDIARLLHDLSITHKPRVAIYSGLPIWGGTDANGNNLPAWTALQQVQQLFDVQRLDASSLASLGNTDADVLVLIQPTGLTHADFRAIDRYVQDGGHLVAYVDPDSEVDGGVASDLQPLFQAWGVAFDPDRVLLDRSRALTVQSPTTGTSVRDPSVLGLTGDELNRRDPVTKALSMIDVAATGYFGLLPGATIRLDPLIQSTTEAMVVPTQRVRSSDPGALYKDYVPGGEHYAIAVRLKGELPDAFPGDAPARPPTGKPQVILVGDTDLLSDRLWVQPSPTLGQTLMSPFANNGDFFVNTIDDLAGPSNLIAIRGRAVSERRFTRVDTLRRQADEKFKAKQLELQAELSDTEGKLDALKHGAQGRGRTAAQKAAVEQFLRRKLEIRGELRAVQRSLDADIQRLSMELKFVDILLMPILVALIGLLYGLWRVRRRRFGGDWR
ncbi:MAG: ABC transporter [Rhodanobacteraceae bacterium]|nr:MAG: ABC transporter [Rhodanobacteraceae bacterium]